MPITKDLYFKALEENKAFSSDSLNGNETLIDLEYEILDAFVNSKYHNMDLNIENYEKNLIIKNYLRMIVPDNKFSRFLFLACVFTFRLG